jgi:hypothetical protein
MTKSSEFTILRLWSSIQLPDYHTVTQSFRQDNSGLFRHFLGCRWTTINPFYKGAYAVVVMAKERRREKEKDAL